MVHTLATSLVTGKNTPGLLLLYFTIDLYARLAELPPSGLPIQRWVLYCRVSTWWGPKRRVLNRVNSLMNWTMHGFRSDDDITTPSAIIYSQFWEGYDPNRNYLGLV